MSDFITRLKAWFSELPPFRFRLVWLFILTLVVAASITVANNYHFPVNNIPGWIIGPATIVGCLLLGWVVNYLIQKKQSGLNPSALCLRIGTVL